MRNIEYNSGYRGVEAHPATLISTTLERDMTGTRLHIRPEIIKPAPAGCKYIALTQGKLTLVDEEDYAWLMQWNWRFHWTGYAVRTESLGDQSIKFRPRRMIHMHRRIMEEPEGLEIDHINGDRSDNRRSNLRIGTRSQNCQNSLKRANPTSSKYKGVSWIQAHGKWSARIKHNNKLIHLGYFDTEDEAGCAYNVAALNLYGEWAKVNPLPFKGGSE